MSVVRRSVYAAVAAPLVIFAAQAPQPPGILVHIGGGQRLHVNCTGSGSPAVVFENGAGDFSVVWSLVQPLVSQFTRACSYDRAGYAWSDPGAQPRTFGQLALELQTLLEKADLAPPYVLVGQSFGGSLVRSFAARYPAVVSGMVLIDAVHEDGYVVYGGQPHHLRDEAKARVEPPPRIALDADTVQRPRGVAAAAVQPLDAPLDRLPAAARQVWQWAAAQPVYRSVQPLEMEWSADEAERFYQQRRTRPASLGNMPLIVLARTTGGYASGMRITAGRLEELRREQQADLARLSTSGSVRFAPASGHNIHVEDPAFVAQAIRDVVQRARRQ